jgi:hypothetical protein
MATVAQTTRVRRLPHVDNLRAVMVAWIIGGHALLGYTAIGGWPYDEVQETTFDSRTELALSVVIGPSALFVIGTFFFVAGLFAPAAMARKGPRRFATDRVVRLGVPWLLFMLLVWPLFMWFAYRAAGRDVSLWWEFTHRQPFLDSGPLWFAEILLYVSVGYAIWTWAVHRYGRPDRLSFPELTGRHLVAFGIAIAVTSFVVRLWFPARSKQILDLHVWQLPQCIGMFALGVVAARHAWAAQLPERVKKGAGYTLLGVLVAVPVFAAAAGINDVATDSVPYTGGWHWQAVVLASLEAVLVVAGSIWVLGLAQRKLTGVGPIWQACARGAFAAFVLQAPVLLTLSIMARPFQLPAEAKALLVAGIAVPLCFWLGYLLIDRTRVGRLL